MGVSMRIMSHAVEGQDSNLINNSGNTEEIEYNCDQSINQNLDVVQKNLLRSINTNHLWLGGADSWPIALPPATISLWDPNLPII